MKNSLQAAQNFAKKNPARGRKSKLDPHYDAIKFLLDNNYSLLQIQEFLEKEIKLTVSYSNLQGWVKRRFESIESPKAEANETVSTEALTGQNISADANDPFKTLKDAPKRRKK